MPRRFAYLLFQSHRKGSYLHDGAISIQSGRLREEGVENDIFDTVLDGDNEDENQRLLDLLAHRLVEGKYDIVAVARIWDAGVIHALRAAIGRLTDDVPKFLFLPEKAWGQDLRPYDFICTGGALSVIRAMAAAPEPIDPAKIPGLAVQNDAGELVVTPGQEEEPENEEERWRLRPNFRRIHINPDVVPKSTHLVVYGNPGCPYRRSIREVEAWRDVELDPTVTNTKGCSFCNINLSQDFRFVHGIAEHVVAQISNIHTDVPGAEYIILLDQDPFPYLPEVFQRSIDGGLAPYHLLIQARADLFIRRREKFEAALQLARDGGFGCTPFLIGIENFHQETLDFYNKGVTVETNIEVLEYLRGIMARYPDVFDPDHVSPGFILWHPWVTFESLRTNVDAIARHGLNEFRSEVALSKIRLYPDIPFYWKAREDGLLVDNYSDPGLDSATRYGYPEEAPYRFRHAEAQVAYTLLAGLCRRHEPIEELKLLDRVLDWVEEDPARCHDLEAQSIADPDALLDRFEAEHGPEVLRLRKRRRGKNGGVELPEDVGAALRGVVAPYWPDQPEGPSGFALARVAREQGELRLLFARPGAVDAARRGESGAAFSVTLAPRSPARHFRHTKRWNVAYQTMDTDEDVRAALAAILPEVLERLSRIEDDDDGRLIAGALQR